MAQRMGVSSLRGCHSQPQRRHLNVGSLTVTMALSVHYARHLSTTNFDTRDGNLIGRKVDGMSQEQAPIICDGCGMDITYTGNSIDYRLKLSIWKPLPWFVGEGKRMGAVTDMMEYPVIDDDRHFCNRIQCVEQWVSKWRESLNAPAPAI